MLQSDTCYFRNKSRITTYEYGLFFDNHDLLKKNYLSNLGRKTTGRDRCGKTANF